MSKEKKIILLTDIPPEDVTNVSQEEALEEIPEEEKAPLRADEIGAAVPATSKLQEAMASLWGPSEPEKPASPVSTAPVIEIPSVAPLPLVEKVEEEAPQVRHLKDFTIYDRKAQWQGATPKEDEPYFQILCVGQGCRKPTWTRSQREDVCEECYLTMQKLLDMGHQQNMGQWSTYSGKIGWYQS